MLTQNFCMLVMPRHPEKISKFKLLTFEAFVQIGNIKYVIVKL